MDSTRYPAPGEKYWQTPSYTAYRTRGVPLQPGLKGLLGPALYEAYFPNGAAGELGGVAVPRPDFESLTPPAPTPPQAVPES